jgi:hypothetical protein
MSANAVHALGRLLETNTVIHDSQVDFSIITTGYISRFGPTAHSRSRRTSIGMKNTPIGFILSVDSWLRRLGFYCAATCSTTLNDACIFNISMGFNPSLYITRKTLSMNLDFLRLGSSVSILPGSIRIQNQVPLDSLFMRACEKGDEPLIRQYVQEDSEILNSRAMCSGKTPLLVSPSRYMMKFGVDLNRLSLQLHRRTCLL